MSLSDFTAREAELDQEIDKLIAQLNALRGMKAECAFWKDKFETKPIKEKTKSKA